MQFTAPCPLCHGPMTFRIDQIGSIVACAYCHQSILVPGSPVVPLPPVAESFAVPEQVIRTPNYQRRERGGSRAKLFFGFVGLLVAVVMVCLIYDRAEAWYSRKRMEAISKESLQLIDAGQGQSMRMYELSIEERKITRRHPELRYELSIEDYLRATAK